MQGIAAVSGKIAASVCLVLFSMGAASAVTERPVKADALKMDAPLVWSSVPVRVDPSKQYYERIAGQQQTDEYPIKFRAGTKFSIVNGATFEANGMRIAISDAVPFARQQICQSGAFRTACGRRAFVTMTTALNGKFVDCRAISSDRYQCRSNGRELSQLLAAGQTVGLSTNKASTSSSK